MSSNDERAQTYAEAVENAVLPVRVRQVIAVADAEQAGLRAEVDRLRLGGKALGMVVKQQCDAALDATGLHDWIDDDGDGDWGAIWENLAELRPRMEAAEAKIARVGALIRRDHMPEKHRHDDLGGSDILTHCAGCGVDLDDEPCPYLAALDSDA